MTEFDYTNIYNDRFLEPFREIFRKEFRAVRMYMDIVYKDRGSVWFNLTPGTSETFERRSMGEHRIYSSTLRYYKHFKAERNREWYKYLTIMGEKVKRLIGNNANFTVLATWVSHNDTWGETTTVWSADRDTYCWHDMQLELNYNPDRTEEEEAVGSELAIIEFNLTFRHEEVYT